MALSRKLKNQKSTLFTAPLYLAANSICRISKITNPSPNISTSSNRWSVNSPLNLTFSMIAEQQVRTLRAKNKHIAERAFAPLWIFYNISDFLSLNILSHNNVFSKPLNTNWQFIGETNKHWLLIGKIKIINLWRKNLKWWVGGYMRHTEQSGPHVEKCS